MYENVLEEQTQNFEKHTITVDTGQNPIRIDKYLLDKLPNTTRNKIQQGISMNYVSVNGVIVKSNYKVKPKDLIIFYIPISRNENDIYPENIPLNIVYEDDHLLIINKEAGMVVHPAYQNWDGTLVNALIHHFKNLPEKKGNIGRPGIVHRIDKDTSGLLVVAKSEQAMSHLSQQFLDHSIERTYYALIWGVPKKEKDTITYRLGRSEKDRRITVAYKNEEIGKNAITHYELIKNYRYVSLIKCKLETGRTHQIRAHMKSIGHPLFNDSTYGGNRILKGTTFSKYKHFVENCFKLLPRQALHAKSLGFIHPISKNYAQFDSPLPDDFDSVINKWEHYVKYT